MASGQKKKVSSGNRVGMIVIGVVVGMLIAILLFRSSQLQKKIARFETSNTALAEQIREEQDRSKSLEDLPGYVRSDEYIEKVAREKFGLVYEDEIIFKPEK